MKDSADPWDVVATLTVEMARMAAALERLAPPPAPTSQRLLRALGVATKFEVFTAGHAWEGARAAAGEAALKGESEPALSLALREARLSNAKELGHWLGRQPQVQRGGLQRGVRQWQIIGKALDLPPLPP